MRLAPVVPAVPVEPGRDAPGVLELAVELSFFLASFNTNLAPADGVAAVSAAATQPTKVASSAALACADDGGVWGDDDGGVWGACAATLIAALANAATVIKLSFRFIAPPRFMFFKLVDPARPTPRSQSALSRGLFDRGTRADERPSAWNLNDLEKLTQLLRR